jgi:hypothetical protein
MIPIFKIDNGIITFFINLYSTRYSSSSRMSHSGDYSRNSCWNEEGYDFTSSSSISSFSRD